MSSTDPYCYPGSTVLINRLGIKEADRLDYAEREIVAQRAAQGVPAGGFDLNHLRAIHRHLFQDVYAWAGEIRTVEIAKGRQQFQFLRYIETGMADVYRRLSDANFLKGLDKQSFANDAGQIIGDVNYVHPFREGNGRTQVIYLKQLAAQAGYDLEIRKIDARRWIAASIAAHRGDYEPISLEIEGTIRVKEI